MSRFAVTHRTADAATLHEFTPPASGAPTLVVGEVTGPAQVLGSSQREEHSDPTGAAAAGVEIVRRRSGGGAVFLSPGAQLWVDVWIPAGDPLWHTDVAKAAVPIGQAWSAALESVGVLGLSVHDGGVVERPWSALVCFAGIGPGEVLDANGAKWVGVSQRRTREWIRLQTMVHRRWSSADAVVGLRLDDGERQAAVRALGAAVGEIGTADPLPALIAALS